MNGRRKNNIITILQKNINPTNEYQKEQLTQYNQSQNGYRTAKNMVYALWSVFSTFYTIHNLMAYKMNIDILLFDRNV